ncbi:hypothetical protein [Thioflexithrix psekupsensis]|uniref:Uncharacterized protein n=1 Tax=Thioflexithrix psekupsensis TaxID=1570016 RepID=A0A251X3V3_9GAMM|nr:hypothetical protein [Thioflexithrix psekupsensis]OUD12174.1 hypothetical protein TPSD3_13700 [Thioflexithrix psekupsensis]
MLALKGIYQNGQIQLDQMVNYEQPVAVIVTFLEDEPLLQPTLTTSKPETLQIAFEKLRALCIEENYEWVIPNRQNRPLEF